MTTEENRISTIIRLKTLNKKRKQLKNREFNCQVDAQFFNDTEKKEQIKNLKTERKKIEKQIFKIIDKL